MLRRDMCASAEMLDMTAHRDREDSADNTKTKVTQYTGTEYERSVNPCSITKANKSSHDPFCSDT